MKLSQKQMKAIRRKAELVINPSGNVGEIKIDKDRLVIDIVNHEIGNFTDSRSMQALLEDLHNLKLCLESKTMWIGYNVKTDQMFIWASL